MDKLSKIKEQIESNSVLLYMKGSPCSPQCGFSAKAVDIIKEYKTPYTHIDVLENTDIRETLPQHTKIERFPQLFVNQELIGGITEILAQHERGELKDKIDLIKI